MAIIQEYQLSTNIPAGPSSSSYKKIITNLQHEAELIGYFIPEKPSRTLLMGLRFKVWLRLCRRSEQALTQLKPNSNPQILHLSNLIGHSLPIIYFNNNQELLLYLNLLLLNFSLKYGHFPLSAYAYGALAILYNLSNKPKKIRKLGRIMYELIRNKTCMPHYGLSMGFYALTLQYWEHPIHNCTELLTTAHSLCMAEGEHYFSCFIAANIVMNDIFSGQSFQTILSKSGSFIVYCEKNKNFPMAHSIRFGIQFMKILKGEITEPISESFLTDSLSQAVSKIPLHWFYLLKLWLCILSDDVENGLTALEQANQVKKESQPIYFYFEHFFLCALFLIVHLNKFSRKSRKIHLKTIRYCHRQLAQWDSICPYNIKAKYYLISAELFRLSDDYILAQDNYNWAIREAKKYGFLNILAIANERLGRFYAVRDKQPTAQVYFDAAKKAYRSWGIERELIAE